MNLTELDIALQGEGWARVSRREWSRPPQLISLTHGRPSDSWELKTLTGVGPITREYFADAEELLNAVRGENK